jgi:site-specific recombinase XerD
MGTLSDRPRRTLRQAQQAWEAARAPFKESPHTTRAYASDILVIARLIAAGEDQGSVADPDADVLDLLGVELLDVAHLRAAFARYAAGHEKSSIARAHSTWRGLTRFLVAEGALVSDPMNAVARPKVPRGAPKPLTAVTPGGGTEQTAAMLVDWLMTGERAGTDRWPERDRAVMLTLLLTGLRSAELRSLTTVSFAGPVDERRISVVGKGGKARAVPIEAALADLLTVYERSRARRFGYPEPPDPYFVDRHGRALGAEQLRYLVRACCRAAGLGDALPRGAVAHSLRHTAATLLSQNGASASELMELLGHASLSTSQGYVQASARETRSAAAANPLYGSLRAAQD